MPLTRSPLDAFDEAPLVTVCEGEVVIAGPLVNAAYTPDAVRVLVARLVAALEQTERQRTA